MTIVGKASWIFFHASLDASFGMMLYGTQQQQRTGLLCYERTVLYWTYILRTMDVGFLNAFYG